MAAVVIADDGPETDPSPPRPDHAEEKRIALDRIEETLRKLDEMRAKELGQQSNLAKKLAKRKVSKQAAPASTWSRGTGYGGNELEGRSKEAEKYRKMVQASHNNTDESWAAAFHHIAMGESNRVLHPNLHNPPRHLIKISNRVASVASRGGGCIPISCPSSDISPATGLKIALLKIDPKKIDKKLVFVFNLSICLPAINIINSKVVITCLLTLSLSLSLPISCTGADIEVSDPDPDQTRIVLEARCALSHRTMHPISHSFNLFHRHQHHVLC